MLVQKNEENVKRKGDEDVVMNKVASVTITYKT